jgi:hypothetical protein
VLRRIFGPKGKRIDEWWRKMHKESGGSRMSHAWDTWKIHTKFWWKNVKSFRAIRWYRKKCDVSVTVTTIRDRKDPGDADETSTKLRSFLFHFDVSSETIN